MTFEFELFVDENDNKMLWVNADNSGTGAEYKYETAKDVGEAISLYLETYYPKVVENLDGYNS